MSQPTPAAVPWHRREDTCGRGFADREDQVFVEFVRKWGIL